MENALVILVNAKHIAMDGKHSSVVRSVCGAAQKVVRIAIHTTSNGDSSNGI